MSMRIDENQRGKFAAKSIDQLFRHEIPPRAKVVNLRSGVFYRGNATGLATNGTIFPSRAEPAIRWEGEAPAEPPSQCALI